MNENNLEQKPYMSFKPYIPADRKIPEFTITSIILGCILSVVFSAANAYLGAKVGMTVSASIPAAVISMGVLRCVLRKNSILENNMVQTIASAGESVAAGCVFTLPALYMWASDEKRLEVSSVISKPAWLTVFLIALIGGLLGITLMIPLRKALIVKEHGILPYPEGVACAEVLLAGEEGSTRSSLVFSGLGIAALFRALGDGIHVFKSEITHNLPNFKGAAAGLSASPALIGVGYICGFKISALMFAGSALSWFVLMPLISFFGGDATMWPAEKAISALEPDDLWGNYIRYIGAGAVACSGIIGLIKSIPLLTKTFIEAINDFKVRNQSNSIKRTDQDMSIVTVIAMSLVLVVALMVIPQITISPLIAVVVFILSVFFCTVTSKIVGYVGASNNPASGMTIASLLLISSILLLMPGSKGPSSWVAAISAASIVCLVSCVASDMSQDLKTGYILGATPKRQQIGEIIGVASSALVVGFVLSILDKAWGFGGKDIAAPQAGLMKLVTEGVMGGELPWTLIFIGAGIALICELIGVASMPFAVGLYLPIGINTCVLLGGLTKLVVNKLHRSEETKKDSESKGLLFASGMIAGEGVIGVVLAALTAFTIGKYSVIDSIRLKLGIPKLIEDGQENIGYLFGNSIVSWIFTLALVAIFVKFIFARKKEIKENQ